MNQDTWAKLEQQVLTWAVDHRPLYVITGITFKTFPHERFQVYKDGILDSRHIYPSGSTLQEVVKQSHDNFISSSSDDMLRPERDSNPAKLKKRDSKLKYQLGISL